MRNVSLVLTAAIVLLGSCSRGSDARGGIEKPAKSESPSAVPVDAGGLSGREVSSESGAPNRPWYAERFEALGFFVFPEPQDIPAFKVQSRVGGSTVGPADFRGKITLLNFWATWCPPCRQEMPSIEALHREMKAEAFAVAAVSVAEKPETVSAFLKQNPYTFPIYLDPSGAASADFASRGIPTTFVLDKDARAVAAVIGARSYDESEVVDLFRELSRR